MMKFNLKTGDPQGTYPLPGKGPFCNDIAISSDGTAYVSDTELASVLMLKPGARKLEIAAKDPLLAGADGIRRQDNALCEQLFHE